MENEKKNCSSSWNAVMWWSTLVVAVLAVPAFGFAMASASRLHGLGAMMVFILACWLCTYLGMKLMHMPGMSKKIIDHKD